MSTNNTDISKEMDIIRKAMIADDPSASGSLAHSWHCNIATVCTDVIQDALLEIDSPLDTIDAYAVGNDAASRFMKLCFGVDTTK